MTNATKETSPRALSTKAQRITITVNSATYERVKTHLLDPGSGRIRYGALSSLVTALLDDWANKREGHGKK